MLSIIFYFFLFLFLILGLIAFFFVGFLFIISFKHICIFLQSLHLEGNRGCISIIVGLSIPVFTNYLSPIKVSPIIQLQTFFSSLSILIFNLNNSIWMMLIKFYPLDLPNLTEFCLNILLYLLNFQFILSNFRCKYMF